MEKEELIKMIDDHADENGTEDISEITRRLLESYDRSDDDEEEEDISDLIRNLIEWLQKKNMSAEEILDCILYVCKE